jgi:hypothetical protein
MIGLLEGDPAWQELLRQEGVSFTAGSWPGDVPVLVLDCAPAEADARRIRGHVESGGVMLASSAHAVALWPEPRPATRRLRWIAPRGKSPFFRNVGIVDTDTEGSPPREANIGITDSGARAILAAPAGRGSRVLLPFDVARVLGSIESGPKRFPARTPRLPFDTVARTSRGEVRRLVANCLRFLLARKGLPYVRLAPVPGQSPSIFAFRVDTDFCPRQDLEAVARLADRVGMKFSWFVNVGAHAAHLDFLADLALDGHDVQLHCQRHTVYPDYGRNLENFRQAKQTMVTSGIKPVGVAAPFGEWNPNLNRAFEDLRFEYSSEFCLAYDDLPFRPVVGGRLSKVLQVPVHPICLGRLVAARASAEQMVAYFRSVTDLQVARQEPCFLYDHPDRIAQFGDVLADVLLYAKERCGATTTMTTYARWWKKRERLDWQALASGSELEIRAPADAGDLSVIVEQGGRYAMMPLRPARRPLDSLAWLSLPQPVRFDRRSLAARKPSLLLWTRGFQRRLRKNLQARRG